MRNQR